jgi:hypothetical protein
VARFFAVTDAVGTGTPAPAAVKIFPLIEPESAPTATPVDSSKKTVVFSMSSQSFRSADGLDRESMKR